MKLRVWCPAKINLFLAVGPKDGRGYHPLRTIFQAVGLYDELLIETAARTEVTSDWPDLPRDNTLTRTLALASEIVEVPPQRIHLTKRIPAGSGLGGGSSDAAGILRALPKITGKSLPSAELMSVAAAVGADVPFFLMGGRAKATGYGEKLTELPDGEEQWLLVVKPEVDCPTGEMYASLDNEKHQWRDFPGTDVLYNDFERVAPCESLELLDRLLLAGAYDSGLTGSGSAVFGRFKTEEGAQTARTKLQAELPGACWVAPALSRTESLRIEQNPL